jgi:creatinine amidohydrolase
VIHPFDLMKTRTDAAIPDVHGGKAETSVMLAVAPDLVRRNLIISSNREPDLGAISSLIFDRGASFPWRTDDPRLTADGVIGEPHAASPELGQAIIDSIIEEVRGVFLRLLESQRYSPDSSVRTRSPPQ